MPLCALQYKRVHYAGPLMITDSSTDWSIKSWSVTLTDLIRSSADADNPDDALRGEPRSPNMVPFNMLVWFSISVI